MAFKSFLAAIFLCTNFLVQAQQPETKYAFEQIRHVKGFFGNDFHIGEKVISKKEVKARLASNPKALHLFQRGMGKVQASNVIGIPVGIWFGWNLGNLLRGDSVNKISIYGSAVVSAITISSGYRGNIMIHRAIKQYNHEGSQDSSLGVHIGLGGQGLAVAIRF